MAGVPPRQAAFRLPSSHPSPHSAGSGSSCPRPYPRRTSFPGFHPGCRCCTPSSTHRNPPATRTAASNTLGRRQSSPLNDTPDAPDRSPASSHNAPPIRSARSTSAYRDNARRAADTAKTPARSASPPPRRAWHTFRRPSAAFPAIHCGTLPLQSALFVRRNPAHSASAAARSRQTPLAAPHCRRKRSRPFREYHTPPGQTDSASLSPPASIPSSHSSPSAGVITSTHAPPYSLLRMSKRQLSP